MLVTIILDLMMPVSHPYSLWTLRYYLQMTKSQLYVKQKCLPSIISNVTNNKNELGKAARLASFQNAQFAIHFNCFRICPSIPTFLFVMLFKPSFLCFEQLFLCSTHFGDGSNCLNFYEFLGTAPLNLCLIIVVFI